MGSGFYGLRKGTDFRKTIIELIMEGGDADRYIVAMFNQDSFFLYYSNGAVCGALLGCKVGFSALPDDLLQFKHRQWLDDQVDQFLTVIGLKK